MVAVEKIQRNIQIAHLPAVDEIDEARIMNSLALCYDKMQKLAGTGVFLHAHFKGKRKKGLHAKHTVQLKIVFPGKTVVAKSIDWNLLTALQSAIKSLERETVEAFKRH